MAVIIHIRRLYNGKEHEFFIEAGDLQLPFNNEGVGDPLQVPSPGHVEIKLGEGVILNLILIRLISCGFLVPFFFIILFIEFIFSCFVLFRFLTITPLYFLQLQILILLCINLMILLEMARHFFFLDSKIEIKDM